MISAETMKWRLQQGKLTDFELVLWEGVGRVVSAGDRLVLQVRGERADYTWERVRDTWCRLQDNHALTVDELGGRHDAIGLVSLFAAVGEDDVEVDAAAGALHLPRAAGRPVRPDPGALQPSAWAQPRRRADAR
jgi:hypothetical protein